MGLRHGLVAPSGYEIVAGDEAQIEARLTAWLAGCTTLIEKFSTKEDVYATFASSVFGFPVDPRVHKVHRFIGKTGVLGLGYQCGVDRFYNMVVRDSRLYGISLDDVGWTRSLAEHTVQEFRSKYHEIKKLWYTLQEATVGAWMHPGMEMWVGPVKITQGRIDGPSGLPMVYGDPRFEDDEYCYTYGRFKHKMYGGKMLENIIQNLAYTVIMNAALRMADHGYNFAGQVHDELIYVVPERDVDEFKKILYRELVKPPSWGPDIPLNAEVKSGRSYGEAKV